MQADDRPRAWSSHQMKARILLLALMLSIGCGSSGQQTATEGSSKARPGSTSASTPVVSSVRILPEAPTKDSELSVILEGQGLSGETVQCEYQWIKNGEDLSGETRAALGAGAFKKGDTLQVRVTPKSEKARGNPVTASAVEILNSPPVVQQVLLEPRVVYATDTLKAVVKATDRDGDPIYFTYRWERNGVVLPEERNETLEPGRFKKGDTITVEVTPDDREVLGTPRKSNPVTIANSPPLIVSSPPTSVQGNVYTYQVMVKDPDDDSVTFALKSGPKGMEIDPKTGLIRWEIRKEDRGTHTIEIEASDHTGAKSLQQYTLAVDVR